MKAQAIASITWTAVTGGTKVAVRMLMSIRRAKGQVKKGSKKFYRTLVDSGIPKDDAYQISKAFSTPAMELLSIRNIVNMAREMGE
ncbi:MAG: hypothetical protein ACTSPR_01735 [Candidatus Thorarchaeota archaeon]|uniref:Type II secretion system protein GspF domain-containing protein n=1 Tax=marine sediment metagenome TaxID=412755 RepID=X1FHR1_9ZZZZ